MVNVVIVAVIVVIVVVISGEFCCVFKLPHVFKCGRGGELFIQISSIMHQVRAACCEEKAPAPIFSTSFHPTLPKFAHFAHFTKLSKPASHIGKMGVT